MLIEIPTRSPPREVVAFIHLRGGATHRVNWEVPLRYRIVDGAAIKAIALEVYEIKAPNWYERPSARWSEPTANDAYLKR